MTEAGSFPQRMRLSEDTIETIQYDPLWLGSNSQYLIDFLKAIRNTVRCG